jgi:hypothetical protein
MNSANAVRFTVTSFLSDCILIYMIIDLYDVLCLISKCCLIYHTRKLKSVKHIPERVLVLASLLLA